MNLFRRLCSVATTSLVAAGCAAAPGATETTSGNIGSELSYESTRAWVDSHEQERRSCETKLRRILAKPGKPGAPGFEQKRIEILTRAKAEPLYLVDTPRFVDDKKPSTAVSSFRVLLSKTRYPWDALERLLPHFRTFPKDGRQTLLRDGYLYTEKPSLAFAIVNQVRAEHLFGHDKIWVKRGQALYHAERRRGQYYFTDGPNQGELVRLLLLDRVGHGTEPRQTVVRDFRALKYRLNFNRAEVRHATDNHIVANLRYGKIWVPSVLTSHGAELRLECQVLSESLNAEVNIAKQEARRRQRVVQALRQAMLKQIEEQLPFDEPRREFGFQLDGKLRSNWRYAYLHGRETYAYNGERYRVFNPSGQPLVPQVCVDFITDTFERASGTWWRNGQEPEGRDVGKLDYRPLGVLERAKLRRVPGFLKYAREASGNFEVLDIKKRDRIPLGERRRFTSSLLDEPDIYQPGDVIVIRGVTPWDPVEMHYHSFFVYESDPLSGIPLAVVGNAGRPTVRYWEVEARRTPKREIWHRARPKTEWLESIVSTEVASDSGPPPISPRGNAG